MTRSRTENDGKLMAAKSNNSVLKSLEEELKCPLCLDIFTEPKKLKCDHVVCLQCLEELVKKSRGCVSCPVCRDTTRLEGSSTSQFPVAHQVNRLIDIYNKTLQEQSASTKDNKESQIPTCSVHTTQPLALYCETCQKAVCRDCFITSCSVKKHECGYLEDMAKKQKNKLEKMLKPVEKIQEEMVTTLFTLSEVNEELERKEQKQLEEINSGFASISLNLAKEKERITTEVKRLYKAQIKINSSNIEELQAEVATFTEAIESAKSTVVENNPVRMFTKMSEQQEALSALPNQRKIFPNVSVEVHTEFKIVPELFNSKQGIFRAGRNYKCLLEKYENLKSLEQKQPFHIHIYVTDLSPRKIKAKFTCTLDNTSTTVNVTEVERDVVKLSFTPQKRGRHLLQVLYSDEDAFGSPFASFVQCPPQLISSLGKPKKISVPNAAAIKCIDNKIYVSSDSLGLNIFGISKANPVHYQATLNTRT